MRHEAFMKEADRAAQAHIDLFGLAPVMTQCGNCPTVLPLAKAVVSVFHITESWSEQEHFCCNQCAKEWWEAFHARD